MKVRIIDHNKLGFLEHHQGKTLEVELRNGYYYVVEPGLKHLRIEKPLVREGGPAELVEIDYSAWAGSWFQPAVT